VQSFTHGSASSKRVKREPETSPEIKQEPEIKREPDIKQELEIFTFRGYFGFDDGE
tara:strand:+ start:5772 stop:5939 length:168 start_codon:yes stop_codon:yes gene_type:complete